jgi:hypothetical protein
MDSASVFGQKGLMAGLGLQGLKITGITPEPRGGDQLSKCPPGHPGDLCRLRSITRLGRAHNTAADSFPDFLIVELDGSIHTLLDVKLDNI